MIELIITACLLLQPANCTELHLPTGFATLASCEENGLILVAGVMMSHPKREAIRFRCERVGPPPFGDNAT